MSEHLGTDALADLLAGEADDAATAHVASCDVCSGALVDLEAALVPVAAELAAYAALPLPDPPADLEQVLLARLAREGAPSRSEAPARPVPLSGGDVVPLQPRRGASSSAPRRPALLGVAAGVVGLLAVVGLGLGLSRGGGSSDAASTAAGGSSADTAQAAPLRDLPAQSTGNDYGPDGRVLARALPGLLEPGAGAAGSGAAGSGAAESGGPGGAASGAGGPGTSKDTAVPGPAAATAPDPLARLHDPAELAGCLAELSGPDSDGVPLALDYARFSGRPALLVVLPSARQGKVDVFAVGAGCRAGDDQTLFFSRVDRP